MEAMNYLRRIQSVFAALLADVNHMILEYPPCSMFTFAPAVQCQLVLRSLNILQYLRCVQPERKLPSV